MYMPEFPSWKTTLESDQFSQISSHKLLRRFFHGKIKGSRVEDISKLHSKSFENLQRKLTKSKHFVKILNIVNNFVGFLLFLLNCLLRRGHIIACSMWFFTRVTKDKWFVRFVVTASWKKRNSFSCSTSSSFFEKAHEDPGFVCCDNYHTPFEKSKTINAISPSTVCIVYYPIMTRVKIFV